MSQSRRLCQLTTRVVRRRYVLTIAPVTIVVFRSAKPTVTAMLVCPDAAKASRATIIKAEALVISADGEAQRNRHDAKIRIAWMRVVESSQRRLRG